MFTWWGLNGSGASEDVLAALGEELRASAAKSRVCADAGQDEDGELARAGSQTSKLSGSVSRTGRE
jgi:hypothetical protein